MRPLAGADGAPGGWVAVRRAPHGSLDVQRFEDARGLLGSLRHGEVLGIDVPIGLPDGPEPRECDVLARELIGSRRASVFPAPVRAVLPTQEHAEANRASRRVCGKGISLQAFHIRGKIREVDALLREDPSLHGSVHEVHPEVSFLAWNREPLRHAKKRRPGREERQRLVDAHFGAGTWADARARHLVKDVPHDDLADAFAALWTAERIAAGRAVTLPARPPQDSCGLPMRIVY